MGKITKSQLSKELIKFIEGSKDTQNISSISYSSYNQRSVKKPQVMYHTNRVSLIETTDIIEIGIDEFTKDKDLLLVHKNGVLLTEMEDYIIADDNMYILNINDYWNEGEDFYFIVINGDSNYYVEGLESKINTIQRQISSITKVLLNLQSRIK